VADHKIKIETLYKESKDGLGKSIKIIKDGLKSATDQAQKLNSALNQIYSTTKNIATQTGGLAGIGQGRGGGLQAIGQGTPTRAFPHPNVNSGQAGLTGTPNWMQPPGGNIPGGAGGPPGNVPPGPAGGNQPGGGGPSAKNWNVGWRGASMVGSGALMGANALVNSIYAYEMQGASLMAGAGQARNMYKMGTINRDWTLQMARLQALSDPNLRSHFKDISDPNTLKSLASPWLSGGENIAKMVGAVGTTAAGIAMMGKGGGNVAFGQGIAAGGMNYASGYMPGVAEAAGLFFNQNRRDDFRAGQAGERTRKMLEALKASDEPLYGAVQKFGQNSTFMTESHRALGMGTGMYDTMMGASLRSGGKVSPEEVLSLLRQTQAAGTATGAVGTLDKIVEVKIAGFDTAAASQLAGAFSGGGIGNANNLLQRFAYGNIEHSVGNSLMSLLSSKAYSLTSGARSGQGMMDFYSSGIGSGADARNRFAANVGAGEFLNNITSGNKDPFSKLFNIVSAQNAGITNPYAAAAAAGMGGEDMMEFLSTGKVPKNLSMKGVTATQIKKMWEQERGKGAFYNLGLSGPEGKAYKKFQQVGYSKMTSDEVEAYGSALATVLNEPMETGIAFAQREAAKQQEDILQSRRIGPDKFATDWRDSGLTGGGSRVTPMQMETLSLLPDAAAETPAGKMDTASIQANAELFSRSFVKINEMLSGEADKLEETLEKVDTINKQLDLQIQVMKTRTNRMGGLQ
jgi:hypothetical protein